MIFTALGMDLPITIHRYTKDLMIIGPSTNWTRLEYKIMFHYKIINLLMFIRGETTSKLLSMYAWLFNLY